MALSLNFRKPSPSLTGAGQRGHARVARAEPRQRGIDTRSFYEKLPETNRNSCRRRQRTSGQRQLAAQHNRWSRHRLQKPKFNKGAKILKPKFQTRARRKQHRTRGPTVLLATHARQRRYRPAGLAGCRCTQSWFAGSSGRLRPRKHESIQNTSCLDIASLFIRQGCGTWNNLFHPRQTRCYQRTAQLW